MIKVIVKKKGKVLAQKTLEEQPLTLGSASGCDIRLPSDQVSGEHAVVSVLGGRALIEDQGSHSGTILKGEKISSEFLDSGDIVKIGPYTIEILDTESKGISSEKTEFYTDEDIKENDSINDNDNRAIKEFLGEPPGPETESMDEPDDDIPDTEDFEESSSDKDEKDKLSRVSRDLNSFLDKKLSGDEETGKKSAPPSDGHTMAVELIPDPRLYPLNIDMGDKFIFLEEDEYLLGRSGDADITIDHQSVSSNHATIKKRDNILSITDHNSTNGTKINGEPVYEKALKCHDILQLGDIKFEFLEGAVEPLGESRPSLSFEQEDEAFRGLPPKVEPTTAKRHSNRSMLYLGALVILAVVAIAYIFMNPAPQRKSYITPEDADKKITQAELERNKIILHNLEQAKKLIKSKRFFEAREILNLIVERVDPGNMEAKKLLANIDDIEEAQRLQKEEEKRRRQELRAKISSLMAQGKKAMARNDYRSAKTAFSSILKLDEDNKTARSNLEKAKRLQARMITEKKILKKKMAQIEQYYFQGVSFYEEGNFDQAADALRKVVEFKSSPYYQGASSILSEIEARQLMAIEDQLSEVNALIKSDEILKSENILKSILKRYPRSKEARRIYNKVHKEIVARAKKIYGEGLVYEQVVEDRKSAMESYEDVLRLLPDPKEEYHKKAKKRLRDLK